MFPPIKEIKHLLVTPEQKEVRFVRIKKNKDMIKFKTHWGRSLYMLGITDKEKSENDESALSLALDIKKLK
uniref:Large ribosomal subunit protein eL38 n=1 Tax=Monodelphis domestica TaxID=13616 RepID=A0A5F8H865_MONDO